MRDNNDTTFNLDHNDPPKLIQQGSGTADHGPVPPVGSSDFSSIFSRGHKAATRSVRTLRKETDDLDKTLKPYGPLSHDALTGAIDYPELFASAMKDLCTFRLQVYHLVGTYEETLTSHGIDPDDQAVHQDIAEYLWKLTQEYAALCKEIWAAYGIFEEMTPLGNWGDGDELPQIPGFGHGVVMP